MLHACAVRFDVTENLEKFCELNKAIGYYFGGKTARGDVTVEPSAEPGLQTAPGPRPQPSGRCPLYLIKTSGRLG